MRATTLLSNVLQLNYTRILAVTFDPEGVVVDVAPRSRVPRCSECFCRVRKVHDRREGRRWRHLDLCGMKVHLRYGPRRVNCPRCGVIVELLPWAPTGSWFTYEFEDTVAYLAQCMNTTAVSQLMRVSWETVGGIVSRVVDRCRGEDLLEGLTIIGIDELSYRRHHEYLTVIVDHVQRRIAWVGPGKNVETVKLFFEALGTERAARIELVTMDMSAPYIAAVREAAPKAQIVFDRFHVQRLAHDALDEVRREQVRALEDPEARRALKHTRFALQKNPWNLTRLEEEKISQVQRSNRPLYRGYLLKDTLAAILDRRQVNVARTKLEEWIRWAARSRLAPFRRVARTISTHIDGILAYVRTRLSNGFTEGLNGKIRTLTRRAYGFHSAHGLIALIYLCCSGIVLQPIRKLPVLPLNL